MSWKTYSSVMEKLDEVLDLLEGLDPSKLSLAQVNDMKEYAGLLTHRIELIRNKQLNDMKSNWPAGASHDLAHVRPRKKR